MTRAAARRLELPDGRVNLATTLHGVLVFGHARHEAAVAASATGAGDVRRLAEIVGTGWRVDYAPAASLRGRLTEVDADVLGIVHALGVCSAQLLTDLMPAGASTKRASVYDRVDKLLANGRLQLVRVRPGPGAHRGPGRPVRLFRVAPDAFDELDARGYVPPGAHPPTRRPHPDTAKILPHTLQIGVDLAAFRRLLTAGGCTISRWHSASDARSRLDLRPSSPASGPYGCEVSADPPGDLGTTLVPDILLSVHTRALPWGIRVLVETDRTGRPSYNERKLRRFDWFATIGYANAPQWPRAEDYDPFGLVEMTRTQPQPIRPACLLVVDHRAVSAHLKRADEVMTASISYGSADTRVYPGRRQLLIVDRDDLLSGRNVAYRIGPAPGRSPAQVPLVTPRPILR